MTKEKWTPGPWTAYSFNGNWFVAFESDDSGPALRVGSWFGQREANATLIAAAPDLYEALELMVSKVPFGDEPEYALRALAKARGGK